MRYYRITTKRIDDKKAQNEHHKNNPFRDAKFKTQRFAESALLKIDDDQRQHLEVQHVFGSSNITL